MKKAILAILAVGGAGFLAGYLTVGKRLQAEHAAQMAKLRAEWQAEKEEWEARYAKAASRARPPAAPSALGAPAVALPAAPGNPAAPPPAVRAAVAAPADLLARLKALQSQGGAASQREMVRLLDDLVRAGPASLPAIREFLAANQDLALEPLGKGKAGKKDGLLTGSLRGELLKVVQEIGGEPAEQLLAEVLRGATNGDEMLRLARSLEEMAPGKYKEAAVAAAQAQLNAAAAGSEIKGGNRAYEILAMYGDASYVEQARAQLIQADGRLNKDALEYLQTTLKQENLPLLQSLLQNPQITDPKQKEDVMKMVAELAGTGQPANQLWYESALNPNLADKVREKAIKELEARGFQDRNNPTAADLQLAQARVQLLDLLRGQLQDPGQLATLDQTKARLLIMMDPNLRQALQGQPKAGKK